MDLFDDLPPPSEKSEGTEEGGRTGGRKVIFRVTGAPEEGGRTGGRKVIFRVTGAPSCVNAPSAATDRLELGRVGVAINLYPREYAPP